MKSGSRIRTRTTDNGANHFCRWLHVGLMIGFNDKGKRAQATDCRLVSGLGVDHYV